MFSWPRHGAPRNNKSQRGFITRSNFSYAWCIEFRFIRAFLVLRPTRKFLWKHFIAMFARLRNALRCVTTFRFREICVSFDLSPRYRFLSVRGVTPTLKRLFRNVRSLRSIATAVLLFVIAGTSSTKKYTIEETKEKLAGIWLTERKRFSDLVASEIRWFLVWKWDERRAVTRHR